MPIGQEQEDVLHSGIGGQQHMDEPTVELEMMMICLNKKYSMYNTRIEGETFVYKHKGEFIFTSCGRPSLFKVVPKQFLTILLLEVHLH